MCQKVNQNAFALKNKILLKYTQDSEFHQYKIHYIQQATNF